MLRINTLIPFSRENTILPASCELYLQDRVYHRMTLYATSIFCQRNKKEKNRNNAGIVPDKTCVF